MQQTTQIQPSFTLKTREGGVASADERADEVVIGVGPAFDKHQHHTLIDMPHGAILKELIAGVEEEGFTPGWCAFCARPTSPLWPGCGQPERLGDRHRYPVEGDHGHPSARSAAAQQPELFSRAPLLTLETYRQIGKTPRAMRAKSHLRRCRW